MIKFLKIILNGKHAGVPLRHSNTKQYALLSKKLSVVKSRVSKLCGRLHFGEMISRLRFSINGADHAFAGL